METGNMSKRIQPYAIKEVWHGLLLAILIGAASYGIRILSNEPLLNPLLVAMVIGIIIRTAMVDSDKIKRGLTLAPAIFIPFGIVFYAAKNLNFVKIVKVEIRIIALLVFIVVVYYSVLLLLGKLLGQRKQITYLTATGSGICGASAITIIAPAVDAEPDDISISLVSVAVAAFFALFLLFPFLATLFGLTGEIYSLLSGAVLQFTGFVEVAVRDLPYLKTELPDEELMSLALSVKSVRYLGLLIAIPLFSSLVRRRIYLPWILWAFLGAGLLGTWIYSSNEYFYTNTLIPLIKPIYEFSWSVAMAAVGINADIKKLLSNAGTKAMVMTLVGCFAATITFFIGLLIFHLF
jgi:uncharacterized integral membrane protein (TIGR00698 family)